MRAYAVYFENLTITTAGIIAGIRPHADRGVQLLRAWIGQNGTATPKNFAWSIGTKQSVFPTLTAMAPVALENDQVGTSFWTGGTALTAGTAGVYNAGTDGAGTLTRIIADVFNNMNGGLFIPTPEERIRLLANSSKALVVRLDEAPAGGYTTGWYGGLIYREV